MGREEFWMKRSGFNIMTRLIGLVKPLTGYMILAVAMGVTGHLCASFITVFGGYAILSVLHSGALDLKFLLLWSAAFCGMQSRHATILLPLSCLR